MNERTTISITTGTIVKALLIIAGAWLLYTLRDIAINVVTAVVVASAIEPAVAKMVRNKIPRVVSVVLVYVGLISFIFCVFYFLLPSIVQDFASFATSIPTYLDALGKVGILDQYAQLFGPALAAHVSPDQIMASVRSIFDAQGVFDNTFSAFSAIFGGVFSFIFIVVFSFYFAVVETGMDDFINVIAPDEYRGYVLNLWRRSRDKIGLWMQGQLLLGVIMGVLVFLGLTILGVNHALSLALIAALFEIIPVFGPVLSAIPAIAIAFGDGGVTLGLLTIALYVIAQQFENHLIYPLVVTRVVGVSPLLIILALIIGAKLAGFLGVVLSVPIAATIQELVNDHLAHRAARRTRELGAV